MTRDEILALPDAGILDLVEKLKEGYRMKRTLRYNTTRDFSVHSESVAEHVFACMYLHTFFFPLEDGGPDRNGAQRPHMNRERVYDLLLFHDFGEIIHGDRPTHLKTDADRAQEDLDAHATFATLPKSLGTHAYTMWHEAQDRATWEARFARALDKVEPVFELYDPVNEKSFKRLHFTLEHAKESKLTTTVDFPVIYRFAQVVIANMEKRGVFWKEE